jgi:hypothetical protein
MTSSPRSVGLSKTLCFAAASALALLLVMMFQWDIVDAVTPFLLGPLLASLWVLVALTMIWSLGYAYRYRREGSFVLVPLMISATTLLAAWFVPFTDLWLYANFHLKKAQRELVVAQVTNGELVPNVSHNPKLIALRSGVGVSKGGDEIIVEGLPNEPYVFFFTYRGVLDNYSGFLWVPKGGRPEQFGDAAETGTQIESLGDNWYFVGHR